MTAAFKLVHSPTPVVDWNTLNWHSAQRIVRRLQARIVKATNRVSTKRR
jgi:hypothetical protein